MTTHTELKAAWAAASKKLEEAEARMEDEILAIRNKYSAELSELKAAEQSASLNLARRGY